ncbi:oxalurate catabolism protein HpxZ [Acetobacter suratthaniensis]|uniref:Oxalurate catabolism protein HpxZ n=1 Tax=Acetobacter suratthaniensis TaxID=1502841 RepID=A0ABS3LJD6_9PROT|nr:oxalurate catabolism protein HpxZ [Acetobacter suratthaniensis]MBO1327713.1 oxalurate catabolism protein HpxZ [Acetobacter suratthaniensis]MCX2565695.1 oxalurate catabolism protein HpxZ [Acetobacter suratthaniensis]
MRLNDPDMMVQVARCADAYEEALGRNDMPALDALFWSGPEAVRYGVGENLYGAEAIAAFRRARAGGSPPREVLRRHIVCVNETMAVVSLEFRRIGGTAIGRQMQTWIRGEVGWRILAAHVSIMAERPETDS